MIDLPTQRCQVIKFGVYFLQDAAIAPKLGVLEYTTSSTSGKELLLSSACLVECVR